MENKQETERVENINLKKANAEDADSILAVEKSLEDAKTYSALKSKEEIMEEIYKNFFYLIEQENKIVGDVSYEMKSENHAYISGLVVAPKFQGQGIARQAMEIILAELKNIKIIDLVTHPENKKAIKLYESLGFKKAGEPMENYFNDGEPRIKMVLEK